MRKLSLAERRANALALIKELEDLNDKVAPGDRTRLPPDCVDSVRAMRDEGALKRFILSKKQIVKRMRAALPQSEGGAAATASSASTASSSSSSSTSSSSSSSSSSLDRRKRARADDDARPAGKSNRPASVALLQKRELAKELLRTLIEESAKSTYKAKVTITAEDVDELNENQLTMLIRNKRTILARVRDPDTWRKRYGRPQRPRTVSRDSAASSSSSSSQSSSSSINLSVAEADKDESASPFERTRKPSESAFLPLEVLLVAAGVS